MAAQDLLERLRTACQGRYEIERELGRGGMAVVYLAQDLKHGRQVAIKVLKPEIAAAIGSERFLNEIQVAARLQHPHILPLFDSGSDDGLVYYVMPYVAEMSLGARLRVEGPLPVDEALQYAYGVASALNHAHRHDILHRDIKPENILIEEGEAIVADFGIARAIDAAGGEGLTQTGVVVGTPTYMSPEQALGSSNLDGRSDLYSLGCVLYEMLSGEAPQLADTPQGTFLRRTTEPLPSIRERQPDVPERVDDFLRVALAVDPSDRYADATEFCQALVSVRADALPTAEGKAPKTPSKVGNRGSRLTPWALGGVAAITLAVLLWVVWPRTAQQLPDPSPNTVAVLPFTMRGDAEFAYLDQGMVSLLSTTLDGAGELRTVDPNALLSYIARDVPEAMGPEEAQRVAEHFGAGLFVLGDILQLGNELQIRTALYEKTSGWQMVAGANVKGEADSLAGLVNELTAELAIGRLGEVGAGATRLTHVAVATTHSLPALKSYLEGERHSRSGSIHDATQAFERAVEQDSTFALAWLRLSQNAPWAGSGYEYHMQFTRQCADQAVRFSERLSERDRGLIRAWRAYLYGEADEAERLYRSVLATHPSDVEAWGRLGTVLALMNPLRGRSQVEAKEPYQQVIARDPENGDALAFLASFAATENKPEEVDSLARRYLEVVPGHTDNLYVRSLQAIVTDDGEAQDSLATALCRLGRAYFAGSVRTLAIMTGDLIAADRFARRGIDAGGPVQIPGMMSRFELGQGRWDAAWSFYQEGIGQGSVRPLVLTAHMAVAPFLNLPDSTLQVLRDAIITSPVSMKTALYDADGIAPLIRAYLSGLLSAHLGEHENAIGQAVEIEKLQNSNPPETATLARDFAPSIRATVALLEGRHQEALALITRAPLTAWVGATSGIRYRVYERYLKAELLLAVGQAEEALTWYSTIAEVSEDGLVYLACSHLRRGEIYERTGERDKAIHHYSRFIALWKDCDPGLRPRVEDAKRRRDALLDEPAAT